MGAFDKIRDYYAILEIASSATQSDIKNAYRRLCRVHHPDKNRGREARASECFKIVSEAYDVLSEPSTRKKWEAERAAHLASQHRQRPKMASRPTSTSNTTKPPAPGQPFTWDRGQEWNEAGGSFPRTKKAPKPSPSSSANCFGFSAAAHTPFSSFAVSSPSSKTPPPPQPMLAATTPPQFPFSHPFTTAPTASHSPAAPPKTLPPSPPSSPIYTTAQEALAAALVTEAAADAAISALEEQQKAEKAKKQAAANARKAAEAAMKQSNERKMMRDAEKRGFAGKKRKRGDDEEDEKKTKKAKAWRGNFMVRQWF